MILNSHGTFQYRRESLSPESKFRQPVIDRETIMSPFEEPKVVFSRDERYIEIVNWRPKISEELQALLKRPKKNLWQNFGSEGIKDASSTSIKRSAKPKTMLRKRSDVFPPKKSGRFA